MTYSQKLRDPRWAAFRADFIEARDNPEECDDCGSETGGILHVHHKRYLPGAEPWDYEFSDLRLICEDCHRRIHAAEQRARKLVLLLRPHEVYELDDWLEEMEQALENGLAKVAFARCKNTTRRLNHTENNNAAEIP